MLLLVFCLKLFALQIALRCYNLKDLTESDELLRKKKTLREAPWPSEDRTPGL